MEIRQELSLVNHLHPSQDALIDVSRSIFISHKFAISHFALSFAGNDPFPPTMVIYRKCPLEAKSNILKNEVFQRVPLENALLFQCLCQQLLHNASLVEIVLQFYTVALL